MEYLCNDCPRRCGALRGDDMCGGVCASPALPRLARAAAHFGEEPCISGTRGSGTVFFTGCNLHCVFCQNREISHGKGGKTVTIQELRDILCRLRDTGVHNINLVTGTHFTRAIAEALSGLNLGIPVIWNSSGYESVETLKMLEGLIQIYMPDYKYSDSSLAGRYSMAKDYPQIAAAAIKEMYRQRGSYIKDGEGMLVSGVLLRHLILPGHDENTMSAIDFTADEFPENAILFSLMSQYTPMPGLERFPELCSVIDEELNSRMIAYMQRRKVENGYWQETGSATDELIPDFDLTGV